MAHVFAQHASVALATAKREEGLRVAIDTRHLIGQAQGILMERFGLTADKAFSVLRRYSQDHNVKLRDLAEELVNTRELPSAPS
jgi:AmiR/NasT family two-component response regulator